MKFLAILFAFLGLLAIVPSNSAESFNCKKRCRKNVISCGYDERRDCHRPFGSECLLKTAVCEEGWNYGPVPLLECTSAFDYCQEFYDIRDKKLEKFGIYVVDGKYIFV